MRGVKPQSPRELQGECHRMGHIAARARWRQARERRQLELRPKEDDWHASIAAKLDSLGIPGWIEVFGEPDAAGERPLLGHRRQYPWLDSFLACGTSEIIRLCTCCGERKTFQICCSQKWCPRCQWKLTKARTQLLTVWAQRLKHKKHVVTTQRNFDLISTRKLKEHMRNLGRLRRQKVFADVHGGAVSVEVTNESRGWHLHAHWLIDAEWIDAGELARTWGKLVGQEYAIVKVKDVTASDYVGEACKYLAKGNQIAQWTADEIWQFALAVRGRRFFTTFGQLRQCADDVRQQLEFMKPDRCACDCGSTEFIFKHDTVV